MKKLFSAFILAIFFAVPSKAAGREDFRLDSIDAGDIAGILPAPARDTVPAAALQAEHTQPAEWTVMVYATTKDKLCKSLMWQLLDLKHIGSTEKVNVVIQAAVPVVSANGVISTPTIRIALGKAGDSDTLDQITIAMLKAGEGPIEESVLSVFDDILSMENATDTGDWRRVADFTRWAKTNYPAKRYVFEIYGHGNGFFDPKKTAKGTLIDTDTKNYVTLPELRLLMEQTGKVDVFLMTSCLMQMAEVAYQVKDYADVVVGSSEMMISIGYELYGAVKQLNQNPSISSEELGAMFADSYIARARAFNLPGAQASVLLTSKLPAFVLRLDAWVDAEMALNDRKAIAAAIKQTARFDTFGFSIMGSTAAARQFSVFGDLYDFVEILTVSLPQDTPARLAARQTGRELMDFIARGLLYKYSSFGTSPMGLDFSKVHGLSVYVPPVKMPGSAGTLAGFEQMQETRYWDLPFARETKWGKFLGWVYGGRLQPVRASE
jgi:hypothetical protein